jgi:hypothetical protein
MHRRNWLCRCLVSILPLVLGGVSGCFPVAPEDGEVAAAGLMVTARLAGMADASVVCSDPEELVQDVDNVTGKAELIDNADNVSVGQGDLAVHLMDGNTVLEFVGDFTFLLLGSSYTLDVALLYQGSEMEGVYAGDLELDSGIEVNIESFTVPPLLAQPDGTLAAEGAEFCVSSDAVDQGETFCTTDQDIQNQTLTYDPESNRFSYSYTRPDVDWLDEGLRTIIFSMEGGLEPVPIYRGSTQITVVGNGQTSEAEVVLEPIPNSWPGAAGEGLFGDVSIRFADGRPPVESGAFSLSRSQPLPCDPIP